MRPLRLIIFSLSLLFALATAYGEGIERGLSFKSYEVEPDQRTSFAIPPTGDAALKFGKYFALEFDLKIDTKRECFGYVCRIIVDDTTNIDIVLTNPVNGVLSLNIAAANKDLSPLQSLNSANIAEWNRLKIELTCRNGIITIFENGNEASQIETTDSNEHKIAILFGVNSCGSFATTDVAPMAIRALSLTTREDDSHKYHWELGYCSEKTVKDLSGRINAATNNPEWLAEYNSHWHKIKEFRFGTKVFGVGDIRHNRLFFISRDCVMVFLPDTAETYEYRFQQPLPTNLITNDFVVLPNGDLLYYDPENVVVSSFDFAQRRWDKNIVRSNHSKYLHHNTFINPVDSSVIQLFGYGFHRYHNDMNTLSWSNETITRRSLNDLSPRYLSAVGVADTVAYIYGGKGNERGIQELGITTYNDLYTLNLRNYSVNRLWNRIPAESEVAASNLIVSSDHKSLRALYFNPQTYKTHLQMKESSIVDGTTTILADSIDYDFLDIHSEANLYYDEKRGIYYAVVTHKDKSNEFVSEIYSIRSPIVSLNSLLPAEQSGSPWWIIITSILVAVSVSGVILFSNSHRKKPTTDPVPQPETELPPPQIKRVMPGIYIMGGFQVINQNGHDITAAFTPVMRQLLSLLILFTKSGKGISNAELKDALWFDKSDESYYNNRGVNIRKIRLLLEEVGDINITQSSGYWRVGGNMALCDYTHNLDRLEAINPDAVSSEELAEIIGIANCGVLLPNIQFEWFDRFKAEYADKIISLLGKMRDSAQSASSPDIRIQLSDAIMLFDSLDEDSIRTKCRALIELKRIGIAQNAFNVFTKEYKRLMDEEYGVNFNEFVRKQR